MLGVAVQKVHRSMYGPRHRSSQTGGTPHQRRNHSIYLSDGIDCAEIITMPPLMNTEGLVITRVTGAPVAITY